MNAKWLERAFGGTSPSGTDRPPAWSPRSLVPVMLLVVYGRPSTPHVPAITKEYRPVALLEGRGRGFVQRIYMPSTGRRETAGETRRAELLGKTKGPCRPADWRTGALFAEGKRFELLVRGYRTLVFKTSSFGRSDNLP